MKQSVFTKVYTEKGKNGTFTGRVVATMNYSTKLVTGTQAVTHDDFSRNQPIHKVETFVNEKLEHTESNLLTEDAVLVAVAKAKNTVLLRIQALAHDKPSETFEQKINNILDDKTLKTYNG
ncbi:MAG TPA: hypothetical protein VEA37_05435 [Flavobacterium sp.]|nr:hypothetical protein [Flavobacterium sp.]